MKNFLLKLLTVVFALTLCLGVFSACGDTSETPNPPAHTHDYKILKYNETSHWYECECSEKSNLAVHNLINNKCICGYEVEVHTHDYKILKYNETSHWHECECSEKSDVEAHKGGTATTTQKAVCEVCNQEYGNLLKAVYLREGNYIYFGEYPQTIKEESVTITNTMDSRGYYLGSDNNYYAKVVANPYSSNYKFSNNNKVVDGTTYYFKVEPIRWRILSEENGTAFILCDSIIANKRFDGVDSNNYKESEIRAWLNNEFYNTAFSSLQQKIILTTLVDNSVESTGYIENEYACENTLDKIFLLSYKEATSSEYGLNSYEARKMQTSDYTRATGAWMNIDSNGYWWLRSPYYIYGYYVHDVDFGGDISNGHVGNTCDSVVPALKIQLS